MSQIFRLYEPGELKLNSTFSLSGDSHHILTRVLRKNSGDKVQILNGEGKIATATIDHLGKKNVDVTIVDVVMKEPPDPEIELFVGCLKGEKLNLVVQKSCELGVAAIHFFLSEHSIAMKSTGIVEKATKTAVEAMRQSGNPYLPKFTFEKSLRDIKLTNNPETLHLFLHEKETVTFSELKNRQRPKKIRLFVGPEGGFSENEKLHFVGQGCYSVRIAPYVLRSETAAISAVAICTAMFGG